MPALVPHDRDAMHASAKAWLRSHPNTPASDVHRIRRLVEPGARHAYSVLTMVASKARLGTMGGATPEPCCLCGEWTHAYCESCRLDDGAPFPLCTTCDGAKSVCPQCLAADRTWEVGQAEHAARLHGRDTVLEVNGYHNEIGEYIECRPPLQIDVEDLTHLAGPGGDGLIYAQEIFARVQAAMDARQGAQ